MHQIKHDDTTTITSESPVADIFQLLPAELAELPYSVIVDDVEYRSASPMHIVKTTA